MWALVVTKNNTIKKLQLDTENVTKYKTRVLVTGVHNVKEVIYTEGQDVLDMQYAVIP